MYGICYAAQLQQFIQDFTNSFNFRPLLLLNKLMEAQTIILLNKIILNKVMLLHKAILKVDILLSNLCMFSNLRPVILVAIFAVVCKYKEWARRRRRNCIGTVKHTLNFER